MLYFAFVAAVTTQQTPVEVAPVRLEVDVGQHGETSRWAHHAKPSADTLMTLTVGLTVEAKGRAALEKKFWAVSDPKSAEYGQYIGHSEIAALLAVPQARKDRVTAFFAAAGATRSVLSPSGDLLEVTMPVSAVERALHTTIGEFKHTWRPDVKVLRSRGTYAIDAAVAADVELVADLLQFPALRDADGALRGLVGKGSWNSTCDAAPKCAGLTTPQVLNERYKLGQSNAIAAATTMAVAEFQGQYFKQDDLEKFSTACKRDVVVATVVGGNDPYPGVEAELDIEYIRSVAPAVPLTVVYAQSYSLLEWANKVTSMADSPPVHSVSYGNDEKQQSGRAYMLACNTAFMKAGVAGLSVLFASGDQGVCGREGCGFFKKRFKPDFPGGSPYITVVGGTDFVGDVVGEEMAWTAGGGGFSDDFAIPSYQAEAVAAFKAAGGLPPQKLWNNTGRGYPDVAALGGQKAAYCIVSGGRFEGVAGTSASTPVFAGVVARLNALRLGQGKPVMGFLNPWLYANPSAFQDVTSGTNCGGSHCHAGKDGFTAIAGWDAATGLGTPDFEKLSAAALK